MHFSGSCAAMRRAFRRLAAIALSLICIAGRGGAMLSAASTDNAAELLPGFAQQVIATGLTGATGMAIAPDGRIFVCEQTGALRLVKGGRLLPEPVIKLPVDSFWERGLLGVALDPAETVVIGGHQTKFPAIINRTPRATKIWLRQSVAMKTTGSSCISRR